MSDKWNFRVLLTAFLLLWNKLNFIWLRASSIMLVWIAFSCNFSFPEDFWTFHLSLKKVCFFFMNFLANIFFWLAICLLTLLLGLFFMEFLFFILGELNNQWFFWLHLNFIYSQSLFLAEHIGTHCNPHNLGGWNSRI
jgi:hypothetical protein